jgi:hypothetical protein
MFVTGSSKFETRLRTRKRPKKKSAYSVEYYIKQSEFIICNIWCKDELTV